MVWSRKWGCTATVLSTRATIDRSRSNEGAPVVRITQHPRAAPFSWGRRDQVAIATFHPLCIRPQRRAAQNAEGAPAASMDGRQPLEGRNHAMLRGEPESEQLVQALEQFLGERGDGNTLN